MRGSMWKSWVTDLNFWILYLKETKIAKNSLVQLVRG